MTRLAQANIAQMAGKARLPSYDRGALKTGIVHLGTGAFHRAHQAIFTEDCLEAGDMRWGIQGASLRSASVARQLNPQDGLYSCIVRDGDTAATRVIGACKGVLVAGENSATLIEAMAHADVHIVTLTITEKGYKLDPASGALTMEDTEIVADLTGMSGPVTAPGFLVAALALRKERGLAPFTALSCDNLPENGERLRGAILDFAGAVDPALADWIAKYGAFPSSMVDRIVPATTKEDIAEHESQNGFLDEGLVKTEPFSQWVIEDKFAGPRPDWEQFGVQPTNDVRPWEVAKLRLLNGAHSGLAYLGALAGHAHVHEAMASAPMAAFVESLQCEASSTLTPPVGFDLTAYRGELLARFRNSALMHKTHQIAMDGSQKLPQRLLFTMRHRLDRGQNVDALALAVAGWMRWQAGMDESGVAYPVDDPLASQTRLLYDSATTALDKTRALCSLEAVFGVDLGQDTRFVAAVSARLGHLLTVGAAGATAILVAGAVL